MASLALAPTLDFVDSDEDDASPSCSDLKQHHAQQDGDDGNADADDDNDELGLEVEKVHALAQSPPRPEDNNQQEDEPKFGATTVERQPQSHSDGERRASSLGSHPQEAHSATMAVTTTTDEVCEIERLKKANQGLEQQLRELKVQYGRQVHAMRAELQQRSSAHERSEMEWTRQRELMQRAHNEAIDDCRRAQAQVEVLQERLAQVAAPVDNEAASPPRPESAEEDQSQPPLRLTQQQSYFAASDQHPHRHTISRSVVGPARANAVQHVTCHQQTASSDVITVRATRLGRNRSTPVGIVAPDNGDHPHNASITRLQPPAVVPFRLRESHGEQSRWYPSQSAPASPARPSTFYLRQQPALEQSPTTHPTYPAQDEFVIEIEEEPTLPSGAPSSRPAPSRLDRVAPELTSPEAAADSVNTSSSASDAEPAASTSAWSLFSSPSSLNKQSSLDVEQGFSPPRRHVTPHTAPTPSYSSLDASTFPMF